MKIKKFFKWVLILGVSATFLASAGAVLLIVSGPGLSRFGAGVKKSPIAFVAGGMSYEAHCVNRKDGSFVVEIRRPGSPAPLLTSYSVNPLMTWGVVEEGGVVWVYSGDIGIDVLEQEGSGAWVHSMWTPGRLQPPAEVRKFLNRD